MIAQGLPALNSAWIGPLSGDALPTLSFTVQPRNAWDGETIAPAVVVTSSDPASTATVTLAIASGTGVLSGTTSVAMVAGVATFATLVITGSGAHTLTASAAGHTSATSASFKVATGTGVPGGGTGTLLIGGGMERVLRDGETTAARKRLSLDIRDENGAPWTGSVTGVKAQLSISGATPVPSFNDIVRVGGAAHTIELTDAEAASAAPGDYIESWVPAASGRLESTHAFFHVAAYDAAVDNTASLSDAVADEVQTRTIAAVTVVHGLAPNTVTASALATDAVTEVANAVVEAEWTAVTTLARTGTNGNGGLAITLPTSGAQTSTISTNANAAPIVDFG